MKIHTTYIGYLLDIKIHIWSYLIFCPHVWQKMCLSNGGFPLFAFTWNCPKFLWNFVFALDLHPTFHKSNTEEKNWQKRGANLPFPNEQMQVFQIWTNTFFQAYKYKCRDTSEWVLISTSTPAPPWYNGKVTHSAPQHPTTPHRSPSPKNADIHRNI